MTQAVVDSLKLEAARLFCEYEHLVRKGQTSEAIDVHRDKWIPANNRHLQAVEDLFSEGCKTQSILSSKLNKQLFKEAVRIMITNESKPSTWHCGKVDIGNFIDYLETNYILSPRSI